MDETQEIRQARHCAAVKWLLSKAYNNRVPDNLKEPFYRDHEGQERLKPKIIVDLGNATLYCQTLSNLYSDPNYQSLNHWSILQTLARKGVPVNESTDMPLTETVLIQTNPLRMMAHMAVIESLMLLYAKEVTAGDRILGAIRRISGSNYQPTTGHSAEQSLLNWVSHTCAALKKRIARDVEAGLTDDHGVRLQTPDIPPVRDFQDLCDGICLALLVSYYCPKALQWTDVRINYLPAVEDSIHNVLLVANFSQKHLPYNVFHMLPEDITYMRGSMKLNLVVLLADLFNLFEVHPANCVCYPGMDSPEVIAKLNAGANEHGICHRRGLTVPSVTPIPDLRSELDEPPSGSPTTRPQFQVTFANTSSSGFTHKTAPQPSDHGIGEIGHLDNADNEAFVVHRSRGITTLSSMHLQSQQQDPLVPARLRQSKEKSNMETKADERGDNIPAGRPSNWEQNRRPSFAGRRSRRNSSSEDSQLTIENFGGSQDQLNTIDRFDRERDRERERERERKLSNTNIEPVVAVRSSIADARGTLQIGYDTDSGSEKQDNDTEKYHPLPRQSSCDNVALAATSAQAKSNAPASDSPMGPAQKHSNEPNFGDELRDHAATAITATATATATSLARKSSLSGFPLKSSATNWQNNQSDLYDDDTRSLESTYKLSNIRMKLEEKRRLLEQDKRKIELALLRHQEKLSQDDMEADYMKWETMSNDSKRTSDIDPNELDKYQQSIAIMNMNLQDIQQDIQRLATQQNQIQAQQMQAQQLLQAQQIANMLNQQQTYGSQQHLADVYQHRTLQQQHNFGSSPHLPQSFNANVNAYGSRPPSRDPYQQQQMQALPIQYINDAGQYMYHQQQAPAMVPQPQPQPPPPPHSAPYMSHPSVYNENVVPYNNHSFSGPQYSSPQGQPQPVPPPAPHHQYIPRQSLVYDDYPPSMHGREPNISPQPNNFYVHDSAAGPYPVQRRTWAQPSFEQAQLVDVNAWQTHKKPLKADDSGPWGSPQTMVFHQNGDGGHHQQQPFYAGVRSSPQHGMHQRISSGGGVQRQHSMTNLMEHRSPHVVAKASSAPTPQPPPDDVMAPQSICFIGDEDDVDEIERSIIEKLQSTTISDYTLPLHHQQQQQQQQQADREHTPDDYTNNELVSHKLNITSGNLTYRIPSPSRPSLHPNSFQDPRNSEKNSGEKGFYISFDDDQPKRPKPPLRTKRSPKKEKASDSVDHQVVVKSESETLGGVGGGGGGGDKFNANHKNNTNDTTSSDINKATYNKYTDSPIQLRHVMALGEGSAESGSGRVTKSPIRSSPSPPTPQSPTRLSSTATRQSPSAKSKALVIGTDVSTLDPESVDEMERRKERIMLLSLQRRQQQEEAKERKEQEAAQKREREREKEEERARKKEEQLARRAAILEQHRLKKALEEAEREGKTLDRADTNHKSHSSHGSTIARTRPQRSTRPRPKTIHVDDASVDISEASSISSRGKKGSSSNITGYGQLSSHSMRRDYYRGSQDSLTVKEPNVERGRTLSRISVAKGSTLNFRGRKSNSLMNLCGPKLYKQPASKSNRGIILNAVEYCVFPGAVNREAKQKVLEKIARSEAKYFLVLFRDAGYQFRALYSYTPETEQVFKLYGTGPSQVDEVMFDKFFKYNSGGKCFSQVHTKHLTVTIDAFTIHNSLWQGKKVHLPSKKDMALVI